MNSKALIKRVGQAIARQRKMAKLTQAQVADELAIEVETVSRLETGAISPTIERLDQFANLFGCHFSTFFLSETEENHALAANLAELIQTLKLEERAYLLESILSFVKFSNSRLT
jgi:transcriptional regulator with XRE-family HTH domain